MHLPTFISFINQKPVASDDAIDKAITYLHELINRQDLVNDIWNKYQKFKTKKPDEKILLCLPIYSALEHFVVENKPLVVKKEFSVDTLRKEILNQVPNIVSLPDSFRLLFVNKHEQLLLFFCFISKNLVNRIINNLGLAPFQTFIRDATTNTILDGIQAIESGLNTTPLIEKLKNTEYSIIITQLQILYTLLYQKICESFGENMALRDVNQSYMFVKDGYDHTLVELFFDLIPLGILKEEQFALLSHEQLTQKAAQITKSEREKRIEAQQLSEKLNQKIRESENQNNQLEETKKAMVNLLEDARRLEEDARRERDRAQIIIKSMREALFVVDLNYIIVLANPNAEQLLEVAPNTLTGQLFTKITTVFKGDVAVPQEERLLMRTILTGSSFTTSVDDNYFLLTPKGKIPISISTAPLKDETSGKIIGGLVTFRNITHEKLEKEIIEKTVSERTRELREKNISLELAKTQIGEGWMQLQQEKARLTASINSLAVGFVMTDMSDNILTINQSAMDFLQLNKDTVSMTKIEEILKDKIDLHALHSKQTSNNKPIDLSEVALMNKYFHIIIAPVTIKQFEQSTQIGTVILISDITERKIMERSKDEFFSIASHELRTPLTAIRGNTSMIRDFFADALKDPQLKEMINDIHESSVRLIELVNDFLDTSRLEQGKFEFKSVPFEMEKLVEESLKEYQTTGSERKLYLNYEKPASPLPLVIADRNRTKQVLINLIGNALKFTHEGGVTIKTTVENNFIQTAIIDTGRGVPEKLQGLLFRKFQQAGESLFTRDTTRGTGLGLYISKLMISGMQGTIGLLSSVEGKGSTFAFTLPIAPSAHVETMPKLTNTPQPITPSTIPTTSENIHPTPTPAIASAIAS